MKEIKNYMLPIQTKDLYAKEAVSSISLAHEVADKINEIVKYLNEHEDLTAEKILEQDGKIRKGIIYMKDNLANTIHDLLELMKSNGEVDDLIGEVFSNKLKREISVNDYGAIGDGIHDDTIAINNCIKLNEGKTIKFGKGTYLITKPIELPFSVERKINIDGNGAKIKCYGTMESAFSIPNKLNERDNDAGYPCYIKDLTIDCKDANVNYAIDVADGFKDFKLMNCKAYGTLNGIRIGTNTNGPADVSIENCLLYGKGSEFNGVGVISNRTDNNIYNTRIYGFQTGFEINGYITINQCHVLLRWSNQTSSNFNPIEVNSDEWNKYYTLTKFAKVNSHCKIYGSYCDSTYKFIEDLTTKGNLVTFTNNFYYNSRNNVDSIMFDFNSDYNNYIITNNTFNISKNKMGIGINNPKTFNNFSHIKLENNLIQSVTNLSNPGDLLKVNTFKYKTNINVNADEWYVVGVLSNVSLYNKFILNIYLGGYLYKIHIEIDENHNIKTIEQLLTSDDVSKYTIGFVKDSERDDVMYVCIKRSETHTAFKFNVDIETTDNLMFKVTPSKNTNPITDNCLLTNYSQTEPTITCSLNTSIF